MESLFCLQSEGYEGRWFEYPGGEGFFFYHFFLFFFLFFSRFIFCYINALNLSHKQNIRSFDRYERPLQVKFMSFHYVIFDGLNDASAKHRREITPSLLRF